MRDNDTDRRVRTQWFSAGIRLSQDVHHRRSKPGKMFRKKGSDYVCCSQCIRRDWAPPAPLFYAYVAARDQRCDICGRRIHPAPGVEARLRQRPTREDGQQRRRIAMRERARDLDKRVVRIEYEILDDRPGSDHDA